MASTGWQWLVRENNAIMLFTGKYWFMLWLVLENNGG